MRDPQRIEKILKQIGDLWHKYPDFRLGQLICNVVQDPFLYYIEDQTLVDALISYYATTND